MLRWNNKWIQISKYKLPVTSIKYMIDEKNIKKLKIFINFVIIIINELLNK